MDDIDTFVRRAQAFLDAHARPLPGDAPSEDHSADGFSPLPTLDRDAEIAALTAARAWQATKFDHGFGWIDGDPRYGGSGLSREHVITFRRLERRFDVPSDRFFGVGRGLVTDILCQHATGRMAAALLRALHRGDLICCQLFSEPGAGSDLASLVTKATPTTGGWRINGQKVWTSGAHLSDLGLLLARTSDRGARGITMFLIDMSAPGIEIRPLRQMTGTAHFNEVFLDDVFVPDERRIGPVGGGWRIALDGLAKERASLGPGGSNDSYTSIPFERIAGLAQRLGRSGEPCLRDRLADLFIRNTIATLTAQRIVDTAPDPHSLGPEMAMVKLASSQLLTAASDVLSMTARHEVVVDGCESGAYAWSQMLLGVPGVMIGGGTDQMQRNALAERVLGLPRDPTNGRHQ